jgi:hypothetical protein
LENKDQIPIPVKARSNRIIKYALYFMGGVFLFIGLIIFLVQIPSIQNRLKKETLSWLSKKTGTTLSAEKISLIYPNNISLYKIFIEDNQKDTLLHGGYLGVDLSLWELIKGNITINEIWLEDIDAKLKNDTAGHFNFQHFIDAFASGNEKSMPQDSSAPISIQLKRLKLNRVNFSYEDLSRGLSGNFHIHQLRADGDVLELGTLTFGIKSLEWNGGLVSLNMWDVKKADAGLRADSPSAALPSFLFDQAAISEVQFTYSNKDDGMDMDADIGLFDGEDIKIDLSSQHIHLGTATLRNSNYHFISYPPMSTPAPKNFPPLPNWIVTSANISLLNSGFQYDDNTSAPVKRGMDYSHLNISRINLTGTNLYVSGGDTVSAFVATGNLREKSGLNITSFKGDLLYTTQGVSLKNLLLTTPTTKIEDEIEIGYSSAAYIADNPGELWMKARFKKSRISHRDLLAAAPLLYEYPMFADLPNAVMDVDGRVSGQLKDLTLLDVTFRGFGRTSIRASGQLSGLPDPDNISAKLKITEFSTTDKDIRKIIPEGLIPDYITLPEQFSAKGTLEGSLSGLLKMDIDLNSSFGSAYIKGYIEKADNPALARYNISGRLQNFALGKLTGQQELGKVSANLTAVGNSYEPGQITGQFTLYLKEAEYQGIPYRDISIKANADKGLVSGEMISNEPGQQFDLTFLGNLRGDKPALSSELELIALDLQKLGYSDVPFILSAEAKIDFPHLEVDHPQGYFFLTNVKGIYDTSSFAIDSIYGLASYDGREQYLYLKSDFATAEIRGDFSVNLLFPEIINFINLYYTIANPVPALAGNQQANIKLSIFPSPKLDKLFPSLKFSAPLTFSLIIDTRLCIFDLKGDLPAIAYGNQGIKGATLFALANDTALNYKLFVDDYYYSDIYEIPTLLLQGDILHQILYTDIRLLDNFGRLQHTFAGKINQQDSGYSIHVDPNSVLLNYDKWGLDPQNELFFTTTGIFANSFTFSNGTQALVMQTFGDQLNDPLGVRLFNFKISTITGFARQDSLYLDGTINGFTEIDFTKEHLAFTTDLVVDNLTFKNDTLGDIIVKVSNNKPDIFDIYASLGGFDNEINLAGEYYGTTGAFDLQFDIERLGLEALQPFTMGYLNRMRGHIEGGVSLSGTIDNPVVIGNMLFRDAEANVPLLNSVFSLKDERVRFMRDGVHFNGFTLTDQNGKTAILNGSLKTQNWLDYTYALDFEANDFRVINSTRRDNKLFYGQLFLDTKISFRGNSDRPVVNSFFRANDKTNLTMVMPQVDPEIAEKAGIVEFIDYSNADSVFALRIDSINTSKITGMSLSANLEIDPNARLTFVIDEGNGDMLVARGTANLNTAIDPSGKISLTGTYEIRDGSYEMSVSLVKYRFEIEQGSTIIWTGEPTMADIRITALYGARTAPFDLVENLIMAESPEVQAKFRDRMAFNVRLNIRGELLKPDISFDIQIAETAGSSAEVVNTVNSKLEQLRREESEMNKQVFALMLLGTFVPDNPFGSSAGGANASALARQSVSKLLASQLNQLAGSLISGVDIDIGLDMDTDYSMGTAQNRTDLNLALSKRLLKERLKITVGSNFELEGAARPNEKTANIAGDIKADYMLTRSGQYILRAFRIDQYEVALQGQVVETGVTFIINMEYDKFRELFEKKRKFNPVTL